MFQVTLTSYGQTLVSDRVILEGVILLSDYISSISSVSSISSYNTVYDDDAVGNLKGDIGNVRVLDLSSTTYQAKTILFYVHDNNQKKIVAGYSQNTSLIIKSSSTDTVNLFLSFDFSAFINGFLFSSIQAGFPTASTNSDGLVHIENPDVVSDDEYAVYSKPQVDSLLENKQDSLSAGDGIAITNDVVRTTGIPFGICDSTSTATAFTVTVPGIYKLEDGVCCLVKNGVITSAAGFTLDVNGLGGKPVYSNMAAATAESTIFNVNYTLLFVYDSTRVSGGCWICYRGYYSDKNDNSIGYQLRGNVHTLPTTAKFYRYRLLFTSADGTHFVPSNTSTSTNATSKRDVIQTPIDPFGEIVYYSTTTAIEAEANPGPTYLWTQYPVTLGYSFNRTGAALVLDSFKPLYIKCATQANGSAIIDSTTPYVQALPNTADGKIYIFLGIAASTTAIELLNNHPVYYHDGTSIKVWVGKDSYSKTETDTLLASYVQTSRKVNNKALTSDITLNLDDVADGSTRKLSNYVPTSRTVNSKALSSNITLTLDDVADGTSRSIPTVNNASLTINKGGTDDTGTKTFTANASSNVTINLGLATVASSGSYNDLSNKPTIPTVNNTTITIKKNTNDTGDSFTTNASTAKTINLGLSTVATSGSYNDLSNKPTIPTVNNATLTIKKNTDDTGTAFTANASSNVTCNLGLAGGAFKTVDESISNNSTSTNIPTSKAVSDFVDAKGYITSHQSLADLVATAQFNSSTNKIEFYNKSNTKLSTDIDATPFLKDGMIDSISIVTVTDPNPYGNTPTITLDSYTVKMSAIAIMRAVFDFGLAEANTIANSTLPAIVYTGNKAKDYYSAILAHEKASDASFTLYGAEHKYLRFHYNSDANKQDVDIDLSDLTQELENNLANVAFSGNYNDLINTPTNHVTTNTTQTIAANKTISQGYYLNFGNANIAYSDDYSSSNALQIHSDSLIYIAGDSGGTGLAVGDNECWTPVICFGNWDNDYEGNPDSFKIWQSSSSYVYDNTGSGQSSFDVAGKNLNIYIENAVQSLDDYEGEEDYNSVVFNQYIEDFCKATFNEVGVIKIRSRVAGNDTYTDYKCTNLHPMFISTPTLALGTLHNISEDSDNPEFALDPKIAISVVNNGIKDYLALKLVKNTADTSNDHDGNLMCNDIMCDYIGRGANPVTSIYANNVYAQNFGIPYGECSSEAVTQIKEVKLTTNSNRYVNALTTGMIILIKFTNSNTINAPALRVRNSDDTVVGGGYKFIRRVEGAYVGNDTIHSWNAGETVMFRYDGTYWVMINHTGDLDCLFSRSAGGLYFFKLNITNKSSSTSYTVPRGTSLSSGTYFTINENATSLLYINSYEERVDDTSASYGTSTFSGTYYTMLRFRIAAGTTTSVYVPCLRYN